MKTLTQEHILCAMNILEKELGEWFIVQEVYLPIHFIAMKRAYIELETAMRSEQTMLKNSEAQRIETKLKECLAFIEALKLLRK